MLLSENEVNGQHQTSKSCEVVPFQWVTLDKEHRKECEYNQRDNLLDNLELPESEWSAKLVATDAVSGHLEAVLKKCDTPADKHDAYHAVALELRFECYMTIPCQCHKDI